MLQEKSTTLRFPRRAIGSRTRSAKRRSNSSSAIYMCASLGRSATSANPALGAVCAEPSRFPSKQAYQDTLNHLGLKDDRVRRPPIATPLLLKRLLVRLSGAALLGLISLPGLVCWLPIFVTAKFFSWRVRSSGKLEDVWDEIAHTKL